MKIERSGLYLECDLCQNKDNIIGPNDKVEALWKMAKEQGWVRIPLFGGKASCFVCPDCEAKALQTRYGATWQDHVEYSDDGSYTDQKLFHLIPDTKKALASRELQEVKAVVVTADYQYQGYLVLCCKEDKTWMENHAVFEKIRDVLLFHTEEDHPGRIDLATHFASVVAVKRHGQELLTKIYETWDAKNAELPQSWRFFHLTVASSKEAALYYLASHRGYEYLVVEAK